MTDSTNWNKDAMINNLNEQILRLQEKTKELDGKIAEYEKQMDHHRDVLDLFTSTDNERIASLTRQLVNKITPPIYDYLGKLAERDYEIIVDDIDQRLKEITYELSEQIDENVVDLNQKIKGIAYNLSKQIDEEVEQKILSVIAKKHNIIRVEGENDDNRQR